MSSEPELTCHACRMTPYPPDAPLSTETGLPDGWFVRRINGRTYKLCDCCGSIRHFKGGLSTYLQENLGLPPDARLELDDEAGGGLHRQRVRS
ncbi:MAG: hypothetical protein AB7E80_08740 [Hyphomicrobiaceae bacterium]